MLSRTTVGIVVGVASILVGYCIYFDNKRRNAPDFKKKLRERKFGYVFLEYLMFFNIFLDVNVNKIRNKI